MKFIIATNNPKKLIELKRILNPLGIDAVTAKEFGVSLDEVEETGTTFAENAFIKADAACKLAGIPAIADDSGLCVDALNGAPGVYSARYAGEGSTDAQKIEKLLSELNNVPEYERNAHFTSSVCCVFPNGDKVAANGECEGTIAFEPDGDGGFGYDPIFLYNGVSFGNLTAEQKDKVSHRGKALRIFKEELIKYLEDNDVIK